MKLRMRIKIHLATKMPCTMVDNPGSVSTMSAAARAASVDPYDNNNDDDTNNDDD